MRVAADRPGSLYATMLRLVPGASRLSDRPTEAVRRLLDVLAERGWTPTDLEDLDPLREPVQRAVPAELQRRLQVLVDSGDVGRDHQSVDARGRELARQIADLMRDARRVLALPLEDPERGQWLKRKHQLLADIEAHGLTR